MTENKFVGIIKWLILSFSLFMFCYQTQVAITNLINPPVVDTTEILNIADIFPPLITICPQDQWNTTTLKEFGYNADKIFFLLGLFGSDQRVLSWAPQENMTYQQQIEALLEVNEKYTEIKDTLDGGWIDIENKKRFYPKFGRCVDIVNYTIGENVELSVTTNNFKAEVFLTDHKLRTMTNFEISSHWGPSIVIQSKKMEKYLIKVEKLSNFDPRKPDDCVEYNDDTFDKCVDEGLQEVWKPLINCNPPWLSTRDQCNGTVDVTNRDQILKNQMVSSTYGSIFDMKTFPAKEKCTKPCTVTRLNIQEYSL